MVIDIPKKFIKDIEKVLPKEINNKFEDEVSEIINVGIETYEDLLLDVVTNKNSLANPENFYDDYILILESYKFIDKESSEPKLSIPDTENFAYGGTLSILQFIVEGVTGMYLELPEVDLEKILKSKDVDDKVKRRLRGLTGLIDSEVPITKRFRLLHTKGTLATTVQNVLDKKLEVFPFSNYSPIELFEPMKQYVDDNINDWINESIEKSLKTVKRRYK